MQEQAVWHRHLSFQPIPLTFSPKFKCEVRKITALYFQKIKNNNKKLKIIRKNPHTISEEITKQGLL